MSTYCDLGHEHHTALLLVPETETSKWDDLYLAILYMMTFERQFS